MFTGSRMINLIVKLDIPALPLTLQYEIHYVSLYVFVSLLDFNQSGPTVCLLAYKQKIFMLLYFRIMRIL